MVSRWGSRSHFMSPPTMVDKPGGWDAHCCVCSTSPPPLKVSHNTKFTLSPAFKITPHHMIFTWWAVANPWLAEAAGPLRHPRRRREDVRKFIYSAKRIG